MKSSWCCENFNTREAWKAAGEKEHLLIQSKTKITVYLDTFFSLFDCTTLHMWTLQFFLILFGKCFSPASLEGDCEGAALLSQLTNSQLDHLTTPER